MPICIILLIFWCKAARPDGVEEWSKSTIKHHLVRLKIQELISNNILFFSCLLTFPTSMRSFLIVLYTNVGWWFLFSKKKKKLHNRKIYCSVEEEELCFCSFLLSQSSNPLCYIKDARRWCFLFASTAQKYGAVPYLWNHIGVGLNKTFCHALCLRRHGYLFSLHHTQRIPQRTAFSKNEGALLYQGTIVLTFELKTRICGEATNPVGADFQFNGSFQGVGQLFTVVNLEKHVLNSAEILTFLWFVSMAVFLYSSSWIEKHSLRICVSGYMHSFGFINEKENLQSDEVGNAWRIL